MRARSFWPLALSYVALRILLTLVIAVVVVLLSQLAGLDMPVLVAAMLAVIIQLPLAWLVLGSMRRRVTAEVAAAAGERRQLRGELHAALTDRARSGATPSAAASSVPVESVPAESALDSTGAVVDPAGTRDGTPPTAQDGVVRP